MGPGAGQTWHYLILLKKILNKKTIEVYNNGKHYRDFTYIDDIISKTLAVLKKTRVEKKISLTFTILEMENQHSF